FKEPVITPCGHMFCRACLVKSASINPVCPHCRTVFPREQFYDRVHLGENVTDEKKEKKKSASQHDCPVPSKRDISHYGTKMAYLMTLIDWIWKQSPSNRIIVFSQWNRMLKQIGKTLQRAERPVVFVEGSVDSRTK